jgi:two-component system CheB/CheR fusion protein
VARAAKKAASRTSGLLVVGIGASAGGLEACRKLVAALPADTGTALILVQHLDPSHESMMVDLLASHTALTVRQATDGMPVEGGHLYVIPPGTYLSVHDGALKLSDPRPRHGARMPFDFLLQSMASEAALPMACVVLSGTGSDGSLGVSAIKAAGGLVLAQDPEEAAHDGMPRNAMATGAVDRVLPIADMPKVLAAYRRRMLAGAPKTVDLPASVAPDPVPEIIALLRDHADQDFTLYKPGTLRRRIVRRMAMADINPAAIDRYLDLLRRDPAELEQLSKDLLIHVTGFFRDPQVFSHLATSVIPDLLDQVTGDQPLRVWVPGCSTGEEVYSLVMLLRERLTAVPRNLRLQIFASDIDADAVARAREGLYPESIEADVTPERLARFFTKEGGGYRVTSELRAPIVFTVQDVLADAPFSRLDLVSCRNLLIYLSPEAQTKVISLFHFALRPGGILLLGNAETVGNAAAHFEVLSKTVRVYRHIGRSRPGELGFVLGSGGNDRAQRTAGRTPGVSRNASYAELSRKLVMDSFAPAAVLIDHRQECLHFLGPTERYLRVPPGAPTQDILAMAPRGVRTKLRSAIQRAIQEKARITVSGGQLKQDGQVLRFDFDVQPVRADDEDLLLVCFVARPAPSGATDGPAAQRDAANVAELQHDLDATRVELQGAIHNLEMSNDDLKAFNEEARSVSEEYQSANEELLTSKEELQSLNEELTALNTQLQETLERQRTTSNDLQNVLYSTNVATLFLDTELKIRFFTPATKELVSVIPSDIGRPLADLHLLASDRNLLADARTVLQATTPIEREIAGRRGQWYLRRVLPYRTSDTGVEGVVITFADITERRRTAEALEEAKQQADLANAVKSRFLASASHDLRQPLQTLTLLQGLLAKSVEGVRPREFVTRLGDTLSAMSDMLNTLLDINQIEAGTISPEITRVAVNTLFDELRNEFAYHADAQNLGFRMVPCTVSVDTDARLLGQILRNLLSNALKYTRRGKVLLGCRRHRGKLRIEVWDTGIGIPKSEREAVFDEYHQLGNPARERSRGLGLGLAIARRMADLLGHRIKVRSWVGKGSVFTVEIALPSDGMAGQAAAARPAAAETATNERQRGTILVVEDDAELREALRAFLDSEGHSVTVAADGVAAMEIVAQDGVDPDLILVDFNLPNGIDGCKAAMRLRDALQREVPAVILTGDVSATTLRDHVIPRCVRLYKPVKLIELTHAIQGLLAAPDAPEARPMPETAADATQP